MHRKDGFIFVFDVTKQESYAEAIKRLEETRKSKLQKKVPCILAGNKVDLEK